MNFLSMTGRRTGCGAGASGSETNATADIEPFADTPWLSSPRGSLLSWPDIRVSSRITSTFRTSTSPGVFESVAEDDGSCPSTGATIRSVRASKRGVFKYVPLFWRFVVEPDIGGGAGGYPTVVGTYCATSAPRQGQFGKFVFNELALLSRTGTELCAVYVQR